MRTFIGETCVINYNSDMSGLINIQTPTSRLDISGDDVLDFIAEFVRSEKISQLENAETKEILGIKRKD